MNKNMAKPNVETEEEKKAKQVVEDIATNIARLSREVSALLSGRLKKDTVVILLANSTRLPKYQIEAVLSALVEMEKTYLR